MVWLKVLHLLKQPAGGKLVSQAKLAKGLSVVRGRVFPVHSCSGCSLGAIEIDVLSNHGSLSVGNHFLEYFLGFFLLAQFFQGEAGPVTEILAAFELEVLIGS